MSDLETLWRRKYYDKVEELVRAEKKIETRDRALERARSRLEYYRDFEGLRAIDAILTPTSNPICPDCDEGPSKCQGDCKK